MAIASTSVQLPEISEIPHQPGPVFRFPKHYFGGGGGGELFFGPSNRPGFNNGRFCTTTKQATGLLSYMCDGIQREESEGL